ncbi:MAG: MATE family efflux transporter [Clostridiales bacterium]|nr:MATE family efflux transporter [Clostridiales bacterium]
MAKFKRSDADMTQGVIWKQLITFAVPMMLGMLFQQLYNTVDTLVVGQFVGKEALAAVGSTGSIINTLVGIFNGLSLGATVVISQCYGAHDDKGLHKAVQTTFMMTFILCVIITALGMVLVNPLVRMMDTPDDVFGESTAYLRIYFAGISGLMVYNMGSGVLRAVGDSKRPLYFLIFSACMNIVLDLVFVIVFKLGVSGVAYATIISQFLSSLLVLYVLTKTDANYKIDWRNLHLDMPMLKKIFGIGFPTSIQQGITSFSNVFVQSYINNFGSAVMAAWSIYNKLDIYALIPMQCIAAASSTFVGQNYGAKNLPRAKKGVTKALQLSLGISVVLIAILMMLRTTFVKFFNSDPEVIEYAEFFIGLISPFYLLTTFNQIYSGALRGSGDTKVPVIIMMSSFVVFRQAYLFVAKALGNNFFMISLAYPAGWVLCSLLMFLYYHRSKFFKQAVLDEKSASEAAGA